MEQHRLPDSTPWCAVRPRRIRFARSCYRKQNSPGGNGVTTRHVFAAITATMAAGFLAVCVSRAQTFWGHSDSRSLGVTVPELCNFARNRRRPARDFGQILSRSPAAIRYRAGSRAVCRWWEHLPVVPGRAAQFVIRHFTPRCFAGRSQLVTCRLPWGWDRSCGISPRASLSARN